MLTPFFTILLIARPTRHLKRIRHNSPNFLTFKSSPSVIRIASTLICITNPGISPYRASYQIHQTPASSLDRDLCRSAARQTLSAPPSCRLLNLGLPSFLHLVLRSERHRQHSFYDTAGHRGKMVNAQHFLIILSLLPLSTLSIVLLPALDSSATSPRRDIFTKKDGGHISGRETPSRWMPKRSVDRQNPPRHANVGVGGVDVHVHSRRRERLQRRAQVNGSITPLGTALE